MPAINVNYYVPVQPAPVPLFANNANYFNNPVEASLTPVGTNQVNDSAEWYVNVVASREFRIYVPDGYSIDGIYTYDQVNDKWIQMGWRQVEYGEDFRRELCYYTDDKLEHRYIEGYRAYVFSENDVFGESVMRTFPVSFNIVKNK